ncbi:MAG: hypothetical protein AAF728_14370 [Cyanobacteria bacterium P01_D01_bin.128]
MVKLGKVYAELNPEAGTSDKFALDILWRSQDEVDINDSASELNSIFESLEKPEEIIDYNRKVLTSLNSQDELKYLLDNAQSIGDILGLANFYAKKLFHPSTSGIWD